MIAFIENPRRVPRAKLRCVARVATPDGARWMTSTHDLSRLGCQLATPCAVEPGTRVVVELDDDRAGPALSLGGHVVWCAAAPPWRAGVEFDRGGVAAASVFFERFAAGRPRLCAAVNAPDRVPAAAMLAPAPPPEAVTPVLSGQDARVLRALGAGRSASALVDDLGPDGAVDALFALLARGYVALGAPNGAAARRWAPVLARLA